MYAKLYSTIVDSSLMDEDVNTRYVFMMLLSLANPNGDIFATDERIAGKLVIPLEVFQRAVERLMKPDPRSGLKLEEGRRVMRFDNEKEGRGIRIVSYQFYDTLRRERDRKEYMREFMAEYRYRKTHGLPTEGTAAAIKARKDAKAKGLPDPEPHIPHADDMPAKEAMDGLKAGMPGHTLNPDGSITKNPEVNF